MKILFPIGSFYPAQIGGPDNSVFAIAKALVEQGNDVHVITTDWGIRKEHNVNLNEWNKVDGINVLYGTNSSFTRHLPLNYKPALEEVLKNVDVVHLTAVFTLFSHIVARKCLQSRIPYVWSPRGELLKYTIRVKGLKKKLFLKIPSVRNHFRNSFFHVTSLEEKMYLQTIQKEYCANVIDEKLIFNIPNIADNRIFAEMSVPQNISIKPYILFLSRIDRKKNIETLIDAYSEFSLNEEYNLVIAGRTADDTKYSKELMKLSRKKGLDDRIIFTKDRIEGDEKLSLYKNAELFVLPSHSENFGMVVLESLAQGTPVISTKQTPWRQLEEFSCGYWVDKDTKSMKKAIEKYFSLGGAKKKEMSENAINLAKMYSSDVLGQKYARMYETVLRGNASE